jgi:hypothetical protein
MFFNGKHPGTQIVISVPEIVYCNGGGYITLPHSSVQLTFWLQRVDGLNWYQLDKDNERLKQ